MDIGISRLRHQLHLRKAMKARIDTIAKTIAIDEPIALDELVNFVKALFPANWKEWKVDTNVKLEWHSSPIVIDRYPSRPWEAYWQDDPLYVTGTGTGDPSHRPPPTFCLSTN